MPNSSNEDAIRSQLYNIFVSSGIPKDLASKLVEPLNSDEMKNIERTEMGRHIREQTPGLIKILSDSQAKMIGFRQDKFLEFLRVGKSVKTALKLAGLEEFYDEADIKKFEEANKERNN